MGFTKRFGYCRGCCFALPVAGGIRRHAQPAKAATPRPRMPRVTHRVAPAF